MLVGSRDRDSKIEKGRILGRASLWVPVTWLCVIVDWEGKKNGGAVGAGILKGGRDDILCS